MVVPAFRLSPFVARRRQPPPAPARPLRDVLSPSHLSPSRTADATTPTARLARNARRHSSQFGWRHDGLMSVLIRGGRIVTAVDDYMGDVLVEGGVVARLGRSLDAAAARAIDAG